MFTSLHLTGDKAPALKKKKVHLCSFKSSKTYLKLHSAVAHETHVLLGVLFSDIEPSLLLVIPVRPQYKERKGLCNTIWAYLY